MANFINIDDEKFWNILFDEACVEGNQAERIEKELNKISINNNEVKLKAINEFICEYKKENIVPKVYERIFKMIQLGENDFHVVAEYIDSLYSDLADKVAEKMKEVKIMREILFKAKRIDNGEWVEGLLTIMWGQHHIINPSDENTAYPINTDTLCQYTGFLDKNGIKIWENDILCSHKNEKYIVKWRLGSFELHHRAVATPIYAYAGTDLFLNENTLNLEVIGNIFDNPELLER